MISLISPDAYVVLYLGILMERNNEKQKIMFCYRNLAECPPVLKAFCFSYTDKSVENLKSKHAKQLSVSRDDENKTVIVITVVH